MEKGDFLISDYYGVNSTRRKLEIVAVGEILIIVKDLKGEEICLRPHELVDYTYHSKET